jgi:voltage-gated potassium channel
MPGKPTKPRPSVLPLHGARFAELRKRITIAVVLLLIMNVVGVLGYKLIEHDWSWLDSFFMTVITESTIGYGETKPLDDAGRVFTIVLIFMSVGTVSYAISMLFSLAVGGEFKRIIQGHRMDNAIARLRNHIIICGAGNTGRHIIDEFTKLSVPFIIVERDTDVIATISKHFPSVLVVHGDATDDTTLLSAGIEHAKGLISTLLDDKDNVFVVLSAHSINPGLRIVTKVVQEENREKLRKAGAAEVISPNATGGLRMASVMIRPTVVSFLDQMLRSSEESGHALRVAEEYIDELPELQGKTLAQADIEKHTGLLILALKSPDGKYTFNPPKHTVLKRGDMLIVMGPVDRIAMMKRP